ncbi:unnamed protein product [Paramecium octaurelia]|uniref:PAS domain-containing protein n=1 Tax=Paramecium octaurelia TaxID=43137 RepID=A0A8S1XYZ1_PAROT|nr:unnamed protein product [Paramecium octaurelia]
MIAQLLESICIQVGYFEIQIKLPLLPFFFTVGRLFSLLFVIYPHSYADDLQHTTNPTKDNQFYSLLQLQIELLNEGLGNYKIQHYFSLIFNCAITILVGISIILNYDQKERVDEKVKQQNINTIFMRVFCLLNSFIKVTIIQPLLIIGLYNIKNSLQNQLYLWIINDMLFLCYIHFTQILYFLLTEGALVIQMRSYKKLQVSFVDYITYLLIMSQPYIFTFCSPSIVNYAQSIIYLLITLCELHSIFISRVYSQKAQIYLLIAIHSCGIFISLCIFSNIEKPLIYIFLLTPFLIYIGLFEYHSTLFEMENAEPSLLSQLDLNNLICRKLSNQKSSFHQTCVLNSIKLRKHLLKCSKVECFCHNQYHYSAESEQFGIIPDTIEEEIKFALIKSLKKSIQQQSKDNIYIFCHVLFAQQFHGEVYEIYSKIENKGILDNLSRVQRIKWKVFTMIIKQNLYNSFTAKVENYSKDQSNLQVKINQFVQSESFNQSIKDGLINIIQRKLEFSKILLEQQRQNDFLTQYFDLIKSIDKQETSLRTIYERFPSQKNQSQLMFFYGEIKYDWQKAFDQLQINALDNQLLDQSNDIDINRLTNKMSYVIFSFEERKLKIRSFSKRAPQIFGYKNKAFDNIVNSDLLIPRIIRDNHNGYIEQFLCDGKGSFFRKKAEIICQLKSGLLQNLEFFYDLYFDSNQCFRFIAFFNTIEQVDPTILIDLNNRIQGVNKELFKQLNFNPKTIEALQIEKNFYNISATNFFPSNVLNSNSNTASFQFSFPKESFFLQLVQQKVSLQKIDANLNTYDVICDILFRSNYKIVKFKKMQEIGQFRQLVSMDAQSINDKLFIINDEESILYPYDGNMVSPKESCINNIIFDTQRKTDMKIFSDTEDRNQMIKYSKNEIMHEYSDSCFTEQEDKTVQVLGNIYENDIRNQENRIAGGSQASSMAGLRKSVFYRKYSLINILNKNNIRSPMLLKLVGLLFIILISQFIFLVINIIYSKQDFKSLNYYYESIQINHYFIEPMQKFFLTRYMLQDYQITSYYGELNSTELQFYLKFIMPLLIDSFEEFKQNFQDHFQDESFSSFIKDQYVVVRQQTYHYSPIKLQEYNVTLFNAFSILLDAFYKQQQIYVTNSPTRGTNPHNTYQYINYILFVTIFDQISDQMYEESIVQIDLVVTRWLVLVIPISIIISTIVLLLAYYHNLFNHLLEKFFALNTFVEQSAIESDNARQLFILQTLKQGSDLIHRYKFNLVGKEEMLRKTHVKDKNKIQNEIRSTKSSIKFTKIPLIILIVFFQLQYSLIAGPLTYVGAKYMRKFPDTINFFKSFSDIGVYVPAAFSQKEMLYYFSYFSYFTKDDRAFFIEQIEKAVLKIDTFLSLKIDGDDLQFSPQFLDNYEFYEKNNLCLLLNSTKYFDFDYFCYNSQNGILKLGLITTLNSFSNILKDQLEIDFPMSREIPPKEELEAVYFCSDIVSTITRQMAQDIQEQSIELEQTYDIINGLALTFTLLLMLVVYFRIYQSFKFRLCKTKAISLVFPLQTIFLNDHYERELRRIVTAEQLI